jgi:D,D-heptose 1,7-bisphosphate phosphatase
VKQCVILVGGKGSRLGDITKNFPKPLVSVNTKPFLEHLLSYVKKFGFTKVLLLACHANSEIEKFSQGYDNSNFSLEVIIEKEPLGTGGALINAYNKLENEFFLLNGDSLLDGNWLSIIKNFNDNIDISIALTKVDDCSRYGKVKVNGKLVEKFEEKNINDIKIPGYINAGIYCVRKNILKNFELKNLSFEKDIMKYSVQKKRVSGEKISGYFIDIGTKKTLAEAQLTQWEKNKKAVIFDRDGTLNEDNGYTYKINDLIWKPGAKELIKTLNDKNYYVFVATNQSGIARGKYTEDEMHAFHNAMRNDLNDYGAYIDKFYYCPYHKDGVKLEYIKESNDRKPKTGMLDKITKEWGLNKDNLVFIGDRDIDMDCAKNFNIRGYKYNHNDNLMDFYDKISL